MISATTQKRWSKRFGYDPDADVENSADSVFCSHGAGIIVPWYQVEDQMHVESILEEREKAEKLRCAGRRGRFPAISN